ncbi:MAG: glycosyltransferase, partial [Saprospiraceae bacterium]|nr:glycosyltransferase [Saprospiraceae bacterium]
MDLSVVIVNYNVSHFLEQCIVSVQKALKGIAAEIIVVDNNSVDDSCAMVSSQFPDVILVQNDNNLGFSKANNIGIRLAKGEYVLLLNPDTIVHESCLSTCLKYMQEHKEVGGIGVKMLDGSGRLLPESKRGFPTAWVSFCKMTGLYKLFPNSGFFNGYYMGHLSYDNNVEVEVLTGAFFLAPRKLLNEIHGLDEAFFMYGEDIDLSYRIRQKGYKLMYLSDAQIIHFKGESTKKASFNYWYSFYNAMLIFSQKHHGSSSLFLLKIAVFAKGILSFIKSLVQRTGIIVIDALAIISGLYFIKYFWSLYFFHTPYHFDSAALWFNAGLYVFVWIASFYLLGVYDKKHKIQDLVLSSIFGFVVNLAIYALIPENLRSSRMVLGLTFIFVLLYVLFSRYIFRKFNLGKFYKSSKINKILILGTSDEKIIIESLM